MTRPNRHDAAWSSSVERCLGLVHTATPYFPSYRGTTTRKCSSSAPGPLPHLSNRIFTSYNDLLDHCCAAWNKLADQPWHIMTIGLRDWAHRFRSEAWYNRIFTPEAPGPCNLRRGAAAPRRAFVARSAAPTKPFRARSS